MSSVQHPPLRRRTPGILADYEALLTRAIENLPDSSPTRREDLYQRTRAALVSQLRASRQESSIDSELDILNEVIERVESRISAKAASTALRQLAKPALEGSDGWLGNLLSRASEDDDPRPPPREVSLRSVATTSLQTSESVVAHDSRLQLMRTQTRSTEHRYFKDPVPVQAPPPLPTKSVPAVPRAMSRSEEMDRALRRLQNDSPGVEASALISEDGLMIASALAPNMEESRVAGMTATLVNLGSRAAIELARGEVQEVIVRGEHGYAVLVRAGRGALLLALTNESAKLGLVFFDMREAARALSKVL